MCRVQDVFLELFLLEHQIDDKAQDADKADKHEPHECVETELRFGVLCVVRHCGVLLNVDLIRINGRAEFEPGAENVT